MEAQLFKQSVLKGSALSAIARIPFTSENYSLVVKLFQERFGQKEAIVESLYFKLQNLPKTGKFADIQWVSETIEKVLRQLEAQGESIDEQRVLIQQIISKYPPEVLTKLEEAKEPLRPWSIKSLRKAIFHYVTVQENVQCYVSSVNTNVKGQHFVPRQLTSDSHRPSAEVLTANSQRGSQQEGQIKASLPCIFCKGNHFNDMCDKFTTLTERKQILSQQRRCFIF